MRMYVGRNVLSVEKHWQSFLDEHFVDAAVDHVDHECQIIYVPKFLDQILA